MSTGTPVTVAAGLPPSAVQPGRPHACSTRALDGTVGVRDAVRVGGVVQWCWSRLADYEPQLGGALHVATVTVAPGEHAAVRNVQVRQAYEDRRNAIWARAPQSDLTPADARNGCGIRRLVVSPPPSVRVPLTACPPPARTLPWSPHATAASMRYHQGTLFEAPEPVEETVVLATASGAVGHPPALRRGPATALANRYIVQLCRTDGIGCATWDIRDERPQHVRDGRVPACTAEAGCSVVRADHLRTF